MTGNVITPVFRVGYPNVFKARKNELSGTDEFSLVALFAKGEDLTVLKKAAMDAVIAKWGPDKAKWPKNLRNPLRDQAERVKKSDDGKEVMPAGHEAGAVFLNLKSKQRPGVVDQNVQDIIDESQFYAGCYAKASVRAYAYDQKGNRGVSFGLGNIQKVREGEPLGTRTRPQDDFAPVEAVNAGAGATASDVFA